MYYASRVFIVGLFILNTIPVHAQYLLGLHSVYDDSFREWEIEVELDSTTTIEGSLEPTWGIGNDISEWRFDIGEMDGEIVQRYKHDPGYWELRLDGEIITIKQSWRNDPTQWKISKGDLSFVFRSIKGMQADEWQNNDPDLGDLILYSEHRNDPRDWLIEDFMVEDIPFEMRFAAVFIALYSVVMAR